MMTKGFAKLLRRFQLDTLPPMAKDIMHIWFESINREPIETHEREDIKNRIWTKINASITTQKGELPVKRSHNIVSNYFTYGSVAVITIIIIGSILYGSMNKSNQVNQFSIHKISNNDSEEWQVVKNDNKSIQNILLSDGSRVQLDPGSTLHFPKKFTSKQRIVKLIGNGFFEIEKDPDKPFLVYTGTIRSRVLGTSFRVKHDPSGGAIEVSVVTGKVMVEKVISNDKVDSIQESAKVVLTPNKKVTFFEKSNHYVAGLVDDPKILHKDSEIIGNISFVFDDTKLDVIIERLQLAYGIEIVLSNDQMNNCPITADLSTDNLYDKLEIIGAILHAQYEVTGTTILLTGRGCE